MKKTIIGNLIVIGFSSLILFGCNGGDSSGGSSPSLTVSQNVPNLYVNQKWALKISSSVKLVESIQVVLSSDYGLITSPSKITLSPESPVATVMVGSKISCNTCQVIASANNYTRGSSNVFNVLTGQLPDSGGVGDLETSSGSSSVIASSTNGHVYTSTIDTVNNSSTLWQQISTEVPDGGAINHMDYNAVNNDVYISTTIGNSYVSLGESSEWKILGGGSLPNNSMAGASQIDSAGNLILGTNNDSFVYITSLNGTWKILGSGALPDGGEITDDTAINVTSVNNVESIFVGTSKGNVYVTNLNPSTLTSNAWTLVGGASVGMEISTINVDTTTNIEAGNIYAGTILGEIYSSSGINGHWRKIMDSQDGLTSLIIIDNNSDIYTLFKYVEGSFSTFYSSAPTFNQWGEFSLVSHDLVPDSCTIKKIVTSFPSKKLQFLGTMCGDVYYSTNALQDWIQVGLPSQ